MIIEDCPFCTIPDREELLYSDDLVYLVKTLDTKGHEVRVTVATRRHTTEPTFEELTKAYSVLYDYMDLQCLDEWYIVDKTFGRWPGHWHIVSCDALGTPEELELLAKTPKVMFPLKRVLIGIPAHNEEEHIMGVVAEAKKYGDVMVYNDGSTDHTADVALKAGAKLLMGTENRGYGYALRELFERARCGYDVLITLDSDGQHDPSEIPHFLAALPGCGIVIGNRFIGSSETPKYREAVIKGLNLVAGVGDSQCGFRAYSRRALEAINIKEDGFGASLEILRKAKENDLRISEVACSVTHNGNEHSQSPITQGMNLLETVFWGTIWARPYTVLGIPALVSFLCCLYFGGYLFYFYNRSKVFVFSYALLTGGFFLIWLMLCMSVFFISIQRRLLREIT